MCTDLLHPVEQVRLGFDRAQHLLSLQESCSPSQPPVPEGVGAPDSRTLHGLDKVSLATAGEGLHHLP